VVNARLETLTQNNFDVVKPTLTADGGKVTNKNAAIYTSDLKNPVLAGFEPMIFYSEEDAMPLIQAQVLFCSP
jgi:hypothetical protein